MVLSSRDRRLVDVYMVWLGPSLERRRLRFSFQFNDVKDRDWLSPAPLFSAGGRRRRLSTGPPLPCQSPVSNLFEKVLKPGPGGTSRPAGRSGTSPVRSASQLRALSLPPPYPPCKGNPAPHGLILPRRGLRRASGVRIPLQIRRDAPPMRSVRRLPEGRPRRRPPPDC